ncbi:unnamed protein product [Staurois parvus]|uniref:Uncharacterized protein n=1 Tax=Staurois parvus TaxID=386267 RepID=A0ABN9BQY5_9NEOB|nr:unnamed protein product [Staurois parvus]
MQVVIHYTIIHKSLRCIGAARSCAPNLIFLQVLHSSAAD